MKNTAHYLLGLCVLLLTFKATAQDTNLQITYTPEKSIQNGKHIVLVAGDESYRSEESMPMLAKILSVRHGFKVTVLFPINPESKEIDPDYLQNIPGLNALSNADLMIIATRFRELPDEQMAHIDKYLKEGKPVLGIRTATHAFYYKKNENSPYAKYSFNSKVPGWEGGFGKKVLGETWISHHGAHAKEGTRAAFNGILPQDLQPVLNGVKDIWVSTDTYGIKSLPADAQILVWGISTAGLQPSSPGVWDKTMMPLVWTNGYSVDNGEKGKALTITMGASTDFINEDLRRLLVNSSYWLTGLKNSIQEKANVELVSKYEPSEYGFGKYVKNKKPADYK